MPESVEPFASVDPDIDLHVAQQRQELHDAPLVLLGVIAAGGALGALGRYAAAVFDPPSAGHFPWATFAVNVAGCFLIGVLMTVLERRPTAPRLLRPFLGVGLLGGFTTFSTYAIGAQQLLVHRHLPLALGYLFATVAAALVAVTAGMAVVPAVSRSLVSTGSRR